MRTIMPASSARRAESEAPLLQVELSTSGLAHCSAPEGGCLPGALCCGVVAHLHSEQRARSFESRQRCPHRYGLFAPGILQRKRSIEDELPRRAVACVDCKVAKPLELIAPLWRRGR